MKRAVLLVIMIAGLSGCNTFAGFADDVAAGTRAVSNSF
jgi:predicted small secreted protein